MNRYRVRVAGCLSGFLLLGIAGTAWAIPGPELLPAPATVVNPQSRSPDAVRVGQAADGRAVIAFVSGDRLFVQRLAADGAARGEVTQILQTNDEPLRGLSLAVGANGHYTVGVQAGLGIDARVFIRRYNPDGTRLLAPSEPADGPLTLAFDDAPSCAAAGLSGQNSPAVAVDASGNSAYTFTRTVYCPTGRGGALEPDRTRLFYRYAPVAAAAPDALPMFEQSPVTSAGDRVVETIGSSLALQDNGDGLMTWNGHPEAFQTPATYVLPLRFQAATAPATRIEATNSFDRSAPVIGAKTGGYVLNWVGDFNDPETGNRRSGCYVQARALDGSAQFGVLTLSGCGQNQIVQPDGRFELISSIGSNVLGRRYDASGVETGVYAGGSRPNRFLDRVARAWAPTLANGNYLALYNVDQPDGSQAVLEPVRYGGPDGTPQLNLELNPPGPLTISDGRLVSLFWTSNAPAGSCFGFGNLGGPVPSSGSRLIGRFSTPGVRTYGITCGPGALSKSVTLTVVDPDAVAVNVTWNPASILSGNRATVSWEVINADRCTYLLSGVLADSGAVAPSGAIEYAFSNPGDASFDMSCTGAGGRSGSGSATLTIGTPLPLTVEAAWSPTTIFAGQSSTVTWRSENAVACVGSYSGIRSETGGAEASGSLLFEAGDSAGNLVFTLQCTGVDGEVESASATLVVRPVVPELNVAWNAPAIFAGDPATVTWSSTGAQACTGQFTGVYEAGGPVEASGSLPLPSTLTAGNSTFTLSCIGPGEGRAMAAATITIRPVVPVLNVAWNASTIFAGDPAAVTWSSTGAQACAGQFTGVYEAGGPVEASGSLPLPSTLTAGSSTFTLSCVGPGEGRAMAAATITIRPLVPVLTVNWTPGEILGLQSATVMWSSSNASACTGAYSGLVDSNGPVEAAGTLVYVAPDAPGSLTFTLNCVGLGGGVASAAATLTVTRIPLPPPPPPPPTGSTADIQLANGTLAQLSTTVGTLVNARVVTTPADLPPRFAPVTDFIGFDVTGIAVGSSVEVTLLLPQGLAPNGYVKCTPACVLYDRAVITGRQVRLVLTDGGPGDADGVADGVIRDPGAPGTVAAEPPPPTLPSKAGGGSAGGLLSLLGLLLVLRRRPVQAHSSGGSR
ncbi:choice-of-anchor U domain-containing protein [Nevskia sp.]|uniref:choice-of-anchor U domain-containing protein n=1 Tax=Nevskia sp. TaxID=1929292 RepID=UPI0025E626E3|nr:choice-of-anchor U domain-containing protein [Nevskia sp.]